MSNRTVAILGIAAFLLLVLNSTFGLVLWLFFVILAVVRLREVSISTSVIIASSLIALIILIVATGQPPYATATTTALNVTTAIHLLAALYAIILLWRLYQVPDLQYLEPVIGIHIPWAAIVCQVFRVLEFDRSDTIVTPDGQVKAQTSFRPYGYLIVESPLLDQRVRLPITHRDDFWLAASVFDEPALMKVFDSIELLVTYAPEQVLPDGRAASFLHVLHYVITPPGALDYYYSMDNGVHWTTPAPEKLFGSFVYSGEISVKVNPNPQL